MQIAALRRCNGKDPFLMAKTIILSRKKRQLRKTSTGRKTSTKGGKISKKNRKALTEMLVFTSFFKR